MGIFSRKPRQQQPASRWVARPDVWSYLQRIGPTEREIVTTLPSLSLLDDMPADEEVIGLMVAYTELPILSGPLPGVIIATDHRLFFWPAPKGGPLFSSWPGGVELLQGGESILHLSIVNPEDTLASDPFKEAIGDNHSGHIAFEIGLDHEAWAREVHWTAIATFMNLRA